MFIVLILVTLAGLTSNELHDFLGPGLLVLAISDHTLAAMIHHSSDVVAEPFLDENVQVHRGSQSNTNWLLAFRMVKSGCVTY